MLFGINIYVVHREKRMTSVLRKYAIPEERTQYFTILATGTIKEYTLKAGGILSSLMTVSDFTTAFDVSSQSFTAYSLLRDLGRQITIYNETIEGSPHIAIFRQVQFVNGTNTEGISPLNTIRLLPFYLCVWTDSSPGTSTSQFQLEQVARVG